MSFNPIELWGKMTIIAQGVVVLLIIMSIYSLTIAFERFLYYRKARNQSVAYAKMVTGFLKQDKLQDAIDASKKFKNSHVARVLSAGLYEFTHDITEGFGYVAAGWSALIFSYSSGAGKPAELCRRSTL